MNQMDRSLAAHSRRGSQPPDADDNKPRHRRSSVWMVNLVIIGIVGLVMYQFFPQATQNVVFDGVLRNGWYLIPLVLLLYTVVRYARRHDDFLDNLGRHRRAIALFAFAAVMMVIWWLGVYAASDYLTYRAFAHSYTQRDGLIRSAPEFLRFTPLENACRDIGNSISTTGEEVECEHVAPVITKQGFGYAAPITPYGVMNTFFQKNPGFMVLDDSYASSGTPAKRLRRLDDVQHYGQGMEWFDSLDYILAKTDFFANYDKPHVLALDDSKPDKLTLVVPKIKYAYLWRLPYWGGVVLVHADGTIEDLDAQKASADPRLRGKWIYPLWLAKHYVQVQNYGLGWGLFTPYVNIPGKLSVEKLEGDNQFPFLTQGDDGKIYLVTATQGQGSARGLYRMYFADASTGVGTFHQFGNHEVVYGAGASRERLTNIPGYQWHHKGEKGGGNIIAVEPVYVVRANDPTLYWKYSITNLTHSGISATAVANSAKPDEIHVFAQRSRFEEWLQGKAVDQPTGGNAGGQVDLKGGLLSAIEKITQELNALRSQVEKLPSR